MDSFERAREDIYREVLLADTDGNAFDTDDFLTIEIKLGHKLSKVIIGNYTLTAGTVVQIAPNANGYIYFIVPTEEQENVNLGIYEYQITTTETDTDYPDNVRQRNFVGICFRLTYGL